MTDCPKVIHFNSEEVSLSNGLYGSIIEAALEANNLELDDLKARYINLIPGAKISSWFSFKQTMVRVLENNSDMTFQSFLNWSKLLDLKTAVQATSYYGCAEEDLFDDPTVFDLDEESEVEIVDDDFIDEEDIKEVELMNHSIGDDLEFDEDPMEDDLEEDLERIEKFLDYSLELAAFSVSSKYDNQEVAECLLDKLVKGLEFLNVEREVEIVSVAGAIEESYMFFAVTAMVDKEHPVVTSFTNQL